MAKKSQKSNKPAAAKSPVLNLKVTKTVKKAKPATQLPVAAETELDSASSEPKLEASDLAAAEIPTSAATTFTEDEASFNDLGPHRSYRWIGYTVAAVIIAVGLFGGFKLVYAHKIYPGVSVNGIFVGGMSQQQAEQTLTQDLATYQKNQILVHYANTTKAVDLAAIDTSTDVTVVVKSAYAHGRNGSWSNNLWQTTRALVLRPTRLAQVNFDPTKLMPVMNLIADQVDTPVTNASLSFSDTGRVVVVPATAGRRLDIGGLVGALEQRISTGSTEAVTAPVTELDPSVSTAALGSLKTQAEGYLQGPVTLTFSAQAQPTTVPVKDMIGWIKIKQAPAALPDRNLTLASFNYPSDAPPVSLSIDPAPVGAYVARLAKSIDQPGQNAALTIESDVATIFQPEKTGYTLDQPAAVSAITAALAKSAADRTLALTVKVTQPEVTAASLNSLGINQLISEGVTYFPGSPAARMQNIRVGASKFNGILVKPDDTFSFESLLGNVDAAAGYAPALVILGDKEVYQYGGGMCQVSSTAYRAALLAGLPIVERHSHSFAVGYYTAPFGVPGVDATVFDASVDFKFKNDTGHYILIQTVLSGTTLKFDFYGTKTKSGVIHAPTFIDPPGGAGWNVTIPSTTVFTRDILDLAGNVIKTDTIKTHYKSSLDFPVVKELN